MIEINHRIEQGIDIVSLEGRLSAADTASVSDTLHRILEEGEQNVSIDMSELAFIDSSGLSVLVSVLKFARKVGGDVVLLNVNSRIMSLLKLTRLHELFEIFDDEESLLESFG